MHARSYLALAKANGEGRRSGRRRVSSLRHFPPAPSARAHERALINLIRDAIGIFDRVGGWQFHRLTWNQQSSRSRGFCASGCFRRSQVGKTNDFRYLEYLEVNRSSGLTEAKVHFWFKSGIERIVLQNLPRKLRPRSGIEPASRFGYSRARCEISRILEMMRD